MILPRGSIPKLATLDTRLETQRLILRPLVEADAEALWPYVSDPELPRMMSWAAHVDIEQTRAFLRGQAEAMLAGSGVSWGIVHADRVVGTISLDDITWQFRAWRIDRAEIGYWLAPALWGQGLMTEATIEVMRFAFDRLGLHKLTIGCLAENQASRRVIEKCAFRFVGRHEDDVFRDGRWWAHLRYELLATEFNDTTNTLRFSRPRPI
jgi:RimJ/RimL family protein N-acetyltransferase